MDGPLNVGKDIDQEGSGAERLLCAQSGTAEWGHGSLGEPDTSMTNRSPSLAFKASGEHRPAPSVTAIEAQHPMSPAEKKY